MVASQQLKTASPSAQQSPSMSKKHARDHENSSEAANLLISPCLSALSSDASGVSKAQVEEKSVVETPTARPHCASIFDVGGWEVENNILGEGVFSFVTTGFSSKTGEKVAMKFIDKAFSKERIGEAQMRSEYELIADLKHPHVLQLLDVFENDKHLVIISELGAGGDLFSYLNARGKLSEDEARFFFHQLLDAVSFFHARGIYHRDLKLENLFFTDESRKTLKVGDWGFACYANSENSKSFVGSTLYSPPEVLSHNVFSGKSSDIWACGVILFSLTAGFLPFGDYKRNRKEFCRRVLAGDFIIPPQVSNKLLSLFYSVFVPKLQHRATLEDMRQHAWTTHNPDCLNSVYDFM